MPERDQNENELFEKGNLLFEQGKFAESCEAFSRLATIPGFESQGHSGCGMSLLKQGDLAGAKTAFESALEFNPQDTFVLSELGRIAELSSDVQSAIDCYQAALRVDPDFAFARERLESIQSVESEQVAVQESDQQGADQQEAGQQEQEERKPTFNVGTMVIGVLALLVALLAISRVPEWFHSQKQPAGEIPQPPKRESKVVTPVCAPGKGSKPFGTADCSWCLEVWREYQSNPTFFATDPQRMKDMHCDYYGVRAP